MSGHDYDVVCVGAGPAGGLVSYLLARRGLSVLLIEQSTWPRAKVCGGGSTQRALSNLPFDVSTVVERRIARVRLDFGAHGCVELTGSELGATVVRASFDAFIVSKAVDAGARLQVSTQLRALEPSAGGISVLTSRGTHRARLLIGADGARSAVRRLLFPEHRPEFAFGLETNFRPARFRPATASFAASRVVFDFAAAGGGYGWVFPKHDHFNVGLYRLHKPTLPGGLRSALARFAAAMPELDGCEPEPAVGHPIPICTGRQPVAQGRGILIGDAAGMTEAFFGEGISFALDSARIAADWAGAWLKHEQGDPAPRYRRALQPLLQDLHWSKAVAHARYRVPTRWMARAAGTPALRDATLALLAGRASYRESFWKMPLLLPAALLQRSTTLRAGAAS
jgi:geranylgeranyl reductase family protein